MSTTTTVSKDNAAEPQNRIHKLNLSSASMGSHREGDCKNHGMSIPAMRRVFQDTHLKRISMSSQNFQHYTYSVSPILYQLRTSIVKSLQLDMFVMQGNPTLPPELGSGNKGTKEGHRHILRRPQLQTVQGRMSQVKD